MGLETVNWSDSIKETQKNWIGRSEGTEVEFKYQRLIADGEVEEGHFTIFTTRADTMFGVSFNGIGTRVRTRGRAYFCGL